MDTQELKQKISPLFRAFGVTRAGLFGSAARGEMRPDSDIDLVVEITKDISLLGFIDLKLQLEEALHRSVDLVEYAALKPLLKEHILKEQISLL